MKPIELKGKQEFRAYQFEVRAEEDEKHGNMIEGVPIVFGARTDLGWFDEIIDPHALDGADLKDVRFLVNHNTDMIPLARSRNNNENSTMQMQVLDDGMHIRVDLDTEHNTESESLYSAVKRGDVSGMSFMFSVDSDKWDDIESDHPTRTVLKISKIYEVSAVTWPAYEQTEIYARCAGAADTAKAELESLKKAQKEAVEARAKAESEAREREIEILSLK